MLPARRATLQINHKHNIYNIYKYTALLSLVVIFVIGIAFLQPASFSDNVHADTTDTASLDMSVNLAPTITIWTTDTNNHDSNQVNISADPDESVSTGSIRAHVSTNNLTGYTLTIQSNSTDAHMKHENSTITDTIAPLTGSGTSSSSWASNQDLNNMWGYSVGNNDSYVGVPGSSTSAVTIDSTSAPNTDNSTDITFAAKADMSLPAGTYTDTVIFSAVANIVPDGNMQDFTASDCAALPVWSSTDDDLILTDTRDGNNYKVRKLAGNNCWMVQNLRLINKTITPADSNMTSGEFTVPASSTDWGTEETQYDAKAYDSGNTEYGVYYNWYTATAGTGDNTLTDDGTNAPASICPKGWRLPDGSDWYDVGAAYFGEEAMDPSIKVTDSSVFASSALFLPFSGNFTDGSVKNQGANGHWWSSLVSSSEAYRFSVYRSGNVSAGLSSPRYYGNSVRCLLST